MTNQAAKDPARNNFPLSVAFHSSPPRGGTKTQAGKLGERQEMVYRYTLTRSVNEDVDRLRPRSRFGLVWVGQLLPLALFRTGSQLLEGFRHGGFGFFEAGLGDFQSVLFPVVGIEQLQRQNAAIAVVA